MPRRRCCGLVDEEPCCRRFASEGGSQEEIVLRIEELEALRLKDLGGMDQAEAAASMKISRPTLQRILQSARQKVALALVEGKVIIIQGGSYMVRNRVFECQDCGHVWEVEPCSEGGQHGYEIACPKCKSMKKAKIGDDGEKHVCGGAPHAGSLHHGGCCGH